MSKDENDLIIDLTELMDEEESSKKGTSKQPVIEEKTLKLENDKFDLGEELSKPGPSVNQGEEDFNFDKIFKESLNGIAVAAKTGLDKPLAEKIQTIQEKEYEIEPIQKPLAEQTAGKESKGFAAMDSPISQERIEVLQIIESIKSELPNTVESIVKPVLSELVSEIMVTVRKDLPVIVEKVIQEEIEKLKKID